MEIEIDANEVKVSAGDRHGVILSFEAKAEHILQHFEAKDVVKYFDVDDLLSEIGEVAARKYFDIE